MKWKKIEVLLNKLKDKFKDLELTRKHLVYMIKNLVMK